MDDADKIKRVAQAIDDTETRMNRERYAVPAQKRERYFGRDGKPGYKEKLLEAQARAAIAVIEGK